MFFRKNMVSQSDWDELLCRECTKIRYNNRQNKYDVRNELYMNGKTDLIEGNPGTTLFLFALPMIIGNIFQQLYNMADSVIVGRYVGEDALAAVGASYSYTTVLIMIAIGGGIGASVLAGQYLGAGKYTEMRTAVHTFLVAFFALSVMLAVFSFFLNPHILRALDTPGNVFDDAVLYLQIYSVGLPFMFMYNVLSADFNAMGMSKIPLGLLVFSSVLNVILDLIMVRVFALEVAGVAVATVIAQGISAVVSFAILMRILYRYKTEERAGSFDREMFVTGTKIAVPSIVQQSIVSIGMLLTQSAVNRFGSSALAGFSAGTRLESLCIVPMTAAGNAMSNFTAQNLGAGEEGRVKEGYRAAMGIVAGFGAVLILISRFFYRPIVSLFVDETESAVAFATGCAYFRFVGLFFSFLGFKAVTDGILRGSGDVKMYMAANLVNLAIRVSVAQLASPVFGIEVIWYAVPMGWAANFIISYLWYRTGHWKAKRITDCSK